MEAWRDEGVDRYRVKSVSHVLYNAEIYLDDLTILDTNSVAEVHTIGIRWWVYGWTAERVTCLLIRPNGAIWERVGIATLTSEDWSNAPLNEVVI